MAVVVLAVVIASPVCSLAATESREAKDKAYYKELDAWTKNYTAQIKTLYAAFDAKPSKETLIPKMQLLATQTRS